MSILIYRAVSMILQIMEYALLARVIISWLPVPRENQLIRLLYQITEPVLAPIRRMIEKSAIGINTMFDFSPIVAFLFIGFLRNIIAWILFR